MTRYERYSAALKAKKTTAPYQAWLAERINAWLRTRNDHIPSKGWHYVEHARAVLCSNEKEFDQWLGDNP